MACRIGETHILLLHIDAIVLVYQSGNHERLVIVGLALHAYPHRGLLADARPDLRPVVGSLGQELAILVDGIGLSRWSVVVHAIAHHAVYQAIKMNTVVGAWGQHLSGLDIDKAYTAIAGDHHEIYRNHLDDFCRPHIDDGISLLIDNVCEVFVRAVLGCPI